MTERATKFSAWEIYDAVLNDSMRGRKPPTTEDIDRKFEAAFLDHLKEQDLTIVPIEPTEEMIRGGDMESCVLEDDVIVRIYKAMIGSENG